MSTIELLNKYRGLKVPTYEPAEGTGNKITFDNRLILQIMPKNIGPWHLVKVTLNESSMIITTFVGGTLFVQVPIEIPATMHNEEFCIDYASFKNALKLNKKTVLSVDKLSGFCYVNGVAIGIQGTDEFPYFPEIPKAEKKFELSAAEVCLLGNHIYNGSHEYNDLPDCIGISDTGLVWTDCKTLVYTGKLSQPEILMPKNVFEIIRQYSQDVKIIAGDGRLYCRMDFDGVIVGVYCEQNRSSYPAVESLKSLLFQGTKITVNTDCLVPALKAIGKAKPENNTISLAFAGEKLMIESPKLNKTIGAYSSDEASEKVYLDYKFLLDVTKKYKGNTLAIYFKGGNNPATVELPEITVMIMPISK